ncbi:hypothetical protein [Bacillus sp. ISL-37]|uniref:hypothetical protein n=1 Tax=Bacillus sp. ISL-37 TaxID=2819123 RepID=UPI001BE9F74F|nr:hypothetical protein [Bacillus sp. ISL-37]
MMKGLYLYCSLLLPHLHFMAVMDLEVPGTVTDVLDTGTAADHGMGLADVHGMDSVVVPGMEDHGGKLVS